MLISSGLDAAYFIFGIRDCWTTPESRSAENIKITISSIQYENGKLLVLTTSHSNNIISQ